MQDGVVPGDFKQALVNPLIKKTISWKNEFKNCRYWKGYSKSSP